MPELSPAARAGELILAYRRVGDEVPHPLGLAAALEALAAQVVPEEKVSDFVPGAPQAYALQRRVTRHQLLSIAAEQRGGADG